MPKSYEIQNSFTSGEISPRLYGRTDLAQYKSSVREMYNTYPFLHGGCTRRKGTKYVFTLPTLGAGKPKLIKFVVSRTESYLLVIHDGIMYFIQNGAVVGGGTPVTLTVPWADTELDSLRWAQQGNIMVFAHPNHAPLRLARTSPTSFTLNTISFVHYAVGDIWYKTAPIDLKVISDSDTATNYNVGDYWQWTTAGTSVTVSPALYNSGGGSIGSPPGACVVTRVSGVGTDGVWKATCIYSDSERTEWQVRAPDATYPVHTWTTGNYPQTVTFYQQRLWFGGTPNEPQTVWGSKTADYENFTIGGNADDAVQFTIASSEYDPILQLTAASQSLLVFGYAGEHIISGNGQAITPNNVLVAPQTAHGTNDIKPMPIGSDTLFSQRDGKKVRAVYYDINQSQNLAEDLTLMAEHITGTGITDAAFAQEPDYIVWCVRNDGDLVTITYQRKQSVTGWARQNVGAPVQSIATVPEGVADVVYMAVKRQDLNNLEVPDTYTIEFIGNEYVDSYQTYTSATAQATWTIDPRFNNQTVTVVADGFYAGTHTVTGGQITLTQDANEIVVGIGYENYVTMLHTEPAQGQTGQARAMSLDKLTMRFQDTVGAYIESTDGQQTVLPFIEFSQGYFDQPTAPFSGDKTINLTGWSTNHKIKIGQQAPLPWTLLATIMRVTVNDM